MKISTNLSRKRSWFMWALVPSVTLSLAGIALFVRSAKSERDTDAGRGEARAQGTLGAGSVEVMPDQGVVVRDGTDRVSSGSPVPSKAPAQPMYEESIVERPPNVGSDVAVPAIEAARATTFEGKVTTTATATVIPLSKEMVEHLLRIEQPLQALRELPSVDRDPVFLKRLIGDYEGSITFRERPDILKMTFALSLDEDETRFPAEGKAQISLYMPNGSKLTGLSTQGALGFMKRGKGQNDEIVLSDRGKIEPEEDVSTTRVFQIFFPGSGEAIGTFYRLKDGRVTAKGNISLKRKACDGKASC